LTTKKEENHAIAQDDAQIRGMQEQREYGDLAGLGNAMRYCKAR
jgi:hypothetical protein